MNKLQVRVIKAYITHNTQIGAQMDPFVVFKIGKQSKKTKILVGKGDSPQWNQTIIFQTTNFHHSKLIVTVRDNDIVQTDLIGQVEIDLHKEIQSRNTQPKWYSLKFDKRPAGKIMLQINSQQNLLGYNINSIAQGSYNPVMPPLIYEKNVESTRSIRNYDPNQNSTSKILYSNNKLMFNDIQKQRRAQSRTQVPQPASNLYRTGPPTHYVSSSRNFHPINYSPSSYQVQPTRINTQVYQPSSQNYTSQNYGSQNYSSQIYAPSSQIYAPPSQYYPSPLVDVNKRSLSRIELASKIELTSNMKHMNSHY